MGIEISLYICKTFATSAKQMPMPQCYDAVEIREGDVEVCMVHGC